MITEVAKALKVTEEQILGNRRFLNIVNARHAYWWVLSKCYSRVQIGKLCGINPSTATNGIIKFKTLVKNGDKLSIETYNLVKDIKL